MTDQESSALARAMRERREYPLTDPQSGDLEFWREQQRQLSEIYSNLKISPSSRTAYLCSHAIGCRHTFHCHGCGHTWTEDSDMEDSACACTCSDPSAPRYEDWVIDPMPASPDGQDHEPSRMTHDDDAGEAAYLAYGDYVDWVNVRGERMPDWADLPAKIQNAWRTAIQHAWAIAARAAIAPYATREPARDAFGGRDLWEPVRKLLAYHHGRPGEPAILTADQAEDILELVNSEWGLEGYKSREDREWGTAHPGPET